MKSKIIKITLALILLAGIGGYAGYMTYQNRKNVELLNQLKAQATTPSLSEVESIVSAVTKLMQLPNENPTIGTVSDVEKLKNQPFFAQAVNGDKVLIYASAKKAILFRPSLGKIIDVVPITDAATSSGKVAGAKTSVTPTPSPTPEPTNILLLNGTETVGLANTFESKVKSSTPQARITKETAEKHDYAKSIIVILSPSAKATAEKLSQDLGIEVGETPYGEDLVNRADVAIIIGADKK